MQRDDKTRIGDVLERLARLQQSELWINDLNPAQLAALKYLGQANQYSRAPSQVAAYLGATRGTTSQSLKALAKKGFISELRSKNDKRSIRYDVNEAAEKYLNIHTQIDQSIEHLSEKDAAYIARLLSNVLHRTLSAKGAKSFGVCKSCKHHNRQDGRPYCRLLNVELAQYEIDEICHEHAAAA
ncbi:MarR family winged helix-turn-helix transcriptional regulator [Maritalea sp.]|uniref:MarR family winged helix-turn-helix transcriptional regulator n=1 Tax=Maritalea sp. TaxID=2003361 RepID=UPI003EF68ABB